MGKTDWEVPMAEETLFELPEKQASQSPAPTRPEDARVLRPVRNQIEWMPRSLDAILPEGHKARAIWAFLQKLDLSAFYGSIKAVLDGPGRSTTDPEVLLALWVLATADGIGSARQLDRLCKEHDAYRWLRGGVPINYHMLSDFRVTHKKEQDELITEILASMMSEGLVALERVAQDGMRTRAAAGASSFRRKERLEQCLTEAREQVERLAKERENPDPGVNHRQEAARERAARERERRVQDALKRMPAIKAAKERQGKTLTKDKRAKVTEPRVSTTDPEARVMKMPDGGFRPAYNLEFATEVDSQVIVGVGVTTEGSDGGQALPMVEQIARRTNDQPKAYLMDGGFATRDNITALEKQGIRVYAPTRAPRTETSGRTQGMPRPDDTPEVANWRARMETEEAKHIYRQRAATAECVNARARALGLVQLTVRGTTNVLSVALLVAITHNILRWIALTS
jgi:transposase